jgi:hypothetical protein
MDKVGKDGVITVEEGKSLDTEVEWSKACSSTRATSPPLRHQHPIHGSACWKTPTSSSTRRRSRAQGPVPILEARSPSRQAAADHRRGHRRRSAGHAGGQQAPRHAQGLCRQGPGFGDRRKAMLEDIAILTGGTAIFESSASSSRSWLKTTRPRQEDHIDKDNTTIIEGAGKKRRHQGPHRADPPRDRRHHQRLRPREAPGAPGQAGRRRGPDQRRARPPRRDEGEEGPRRRRPARHPCGRRRGHPPRRRRAPSSAEAPSDATTTRHSAKNINSLSTTDDASPPNLLQTPRIVSLFSHCLEHVKQLFSVDLRIDSQFGGRLELQTTQHSTFPFSSCCAARLRVDRSATPVPDLLPLNRFLGGISTRSRLSLRPSRYSRDVHIGLPGLVPALLGTRLALTHGTCMAHHPWPDRSSASRALPHVEDRVRHFVFCGIPEASPRICGQRRR